MAGKRLANGITCSCLWLAERIRACPFPREPCQNRSCIKHHKRNSLPVMTPENHPGPFHDRIQQNMHIVAHSFSTLAAVSLPLP